MTPLQDEALNLTGMMSAKELLEFAELLKDQIIKKIEDDAKTKKVNSIIEQARMNRIFKPSKSRIR